MSGVILPGQDPKPPLPEEKLGPDQVAYLVLGMRHVVAQQQAMLEQAITSLDMLGLALEELHGEEAFEAALLKAAERYSEPAPQEEEGE